MARFGRRIALALWAVWVAPEAAAQSFLERSLNHTTLDNGLQVIVVENHAVPLATVLIAVRNGAFTQQPGEEGLAHLYEHMVFRAYGNDIAAFDQEVARLNGTSNGTTAVEVVTYYVIVPSERAENAVRLLARLIQGVRFRRDDLDDERRVVLDELARGQSDPEQVLMRRSERELWGDAWHRRDVGGDSTSLHRITLDRLREVFARYYVPNNSALIVTGDVSVAAVVAAARRHFANWRRAPDPFPESAAPPIPTPSGNRAVVMGQRVLDATILIQLQGPSLRSDTASTYAADVLFELLNDPGSAFQQRLVGSGMFQSLQGGYRTLNEAGPITIRGTTSPERAPEALIQLIHELDGLDLLLGITAEDLAIAKRRRRVDAALSLEQTVWSAAELAYWWASGGIDYWLTYRARMNTRTLDDLRSFAQRYVANQPKVIGILASPESAMRIGEWLRGMLRPPQ